MEIDDRIMIGDRVQYTDPINFEEFEGTVVFLETDSLGITFVYIKSVEDKLNIYTDPRFPDKYWMISTNMNILEEG